MPMTTWRRWRRGGMCLKNFKQATGNARAIAVQLTGNQPSIRDDGCGIPERTVR